MTFPNFASSKIRSALVSMMALSVIATGCTTMQTYGAQPGEGQQLYWQNGQPKLVSVGVDSIVAQGHPQ